jgi:hypothetical protein
VQAADGISITAKDPGKGSIEDAVEAMAAKDPQLAWLKAMEARGDVDWQKAKEIHDSWHYSHTGLSPAASMALSVAASAWAWEADFGADFTGSSVAKMAGLAGKASEAMANSVASSMAGNAAVGLANSDGDIGQALKGTFGGDALKGYAIGAGVAGLAEVQFKALGGKSMAGLAGEYVDPATGRLVVDFGSLSGIGHFFASQALQAGAQAALSKLVDGQGSFSDALRTALLNTAAAVGFKLSGDTGWGDGTPQKALLHALVGGMLSEAAGGDFKSGAVAAGASELLSNQLDALLKGLPKDKKDLWLTTGSQLIGIAALGLADPQAGQSALADASWAAEYGALYNRQMHPKEVAFLKQGDVVASYIAYMRRQEGINLTVGEAREMLDKYGSAMLDAGWASVNGRDGATEDFIRAEAAKSGEVYVDSSGKAHPLFSVTQEEYDNPLVNLKEMWLAYASGDPLAQEYVQDNSHDKDWPQLTPEGEAAFRAGQEQGYKDASAQNDAASLWHSLLGLPGYIKQSLSSDEVGPFDEAQLNDYYRMLLRLQGRAYDEGYAYERPWSSAQSQTWLAFPAAAAGGKLVGAGVKSLAEIIDDAIKGASPDAVGVGGGADVAKSVETPSGLSVVVDNMTITAPNGTIIELPEAASLSDVDARIWYLEQEAKIPDLLDKTATLEQQAKQAFELRNAFRTEARNAMQDRVKADGLQENEKNMTWEEAVSKYSQEYYGDDLWNEIIKAASRSRKSVNESLGVVPPKGGKK